MVCTAIVVSIAFNAVLYLIYQSVILRKKSDSRGADYVSIQEIPRQAIYSLTQFSVSLIEDLLEMPPERAFETGRQRQSLICEGRDIPEFLTNAVTLADYQCYGIITHLRNNYPELTADELSVCAMICLGISSETSRTILKMSNPASFYNMRSRIRRKIDCTDDGTTLDKQLESIAGELKKNFFLSK